MALKLCIDCKYFDIEEYRETYKAFKQCKHPKAISMISLIDGTITYGNCDEQRQDMWLVNTCGKAGRWWEPAENE